MRSIRVERALAQAFKGICSVGDDLETMSSEQLVASDSVGLAGTDDPKWQSATNSPTAYQHLSLIDGN